MLGNEGLSIFGDTRTEDTLLALAGMGMGRTYYVNNISGASGNDGLSWNSAFAQPSQAIAASETFRELGGGTPLVTTNDYIPNAIVIQGTGTAYTGITDLGERCYIIGLSAGLMRDGGSGQVRIGAADTDGCDIAAGHVRGMTIYNIQFMGGGNNMYAFRAPNYIQRSRFQDVTFMQAGADLEALFYATNMSGSIMERCHFTDNQGGTKVLYAMQLAAASSDNLITGCTFSQGTTALVALAAGNHVGTNFIGNIFSPIALSAIGFYDLDIAGYAGLYGNFFASTTQITDRISRLVDGRSGGNLSESGYINAATE